MNQIVRIVAVGVVLAVLLSVLREREKALSIELGLAFVVLVLVYLMEPLRQILGLFSDLAGRAGVSPAYLGIVLKALGVAYLTAFGAQLSRDAGEGAIASAIELAGKVLILVLAAPIVVAILDTVIQLFP